MGGITGTLTFDKTSYNEGDTMHATIVRHAVANDTTTQIPTYGSANAGTWVPVLLDKTTATVPVAGGPIASDVGPLTDTDGNTWVEDSDDGTTWLGHAIAIFIGTPPTGQPGPDSPGAPAIPDGVWPMGYQGYVNGVPQPGYVPGGSSGLQVMNRDWNFTTDGKDLSGWEIHGIVKCWTAGNVGIPGIKGNGFLIFGPDAGANVDAYLDCNAHWADASTRPVFENYTMVPTTSLSGVNGLMGCEFTSFNADISGFADNLSPNNLHNGGAPLNITCDWFYFHDPVWFKTDPTDPGHADGNHNDCLAEIVGGTNATFSRGWSTGLCHPTKGDGAYLRSHGPDGGYLPGTPRPLGQGNSSVQFTQNVSHVGGIVFNSVRFGGGWAGTVNCATKGSSTPLGPITFNDCLWDGNYLAGGWDIVGSAAPANIIRNNCKRVDGSALRVSLSG